MNKNGYTTPLSDYQSAKLMKELKASYYLNTDSCSQDTDVYLSLEDGWNNDCSKNIELTNLTGQAVVCHISYLCSEVQCCVRADDIRRTFQVELSVDPCSKIMLIKLERLTIKVDLLVFQFGTVHHFSLVGFLKAE
uniref:Uncharacterized protein n=1 Tax=Magallana gigas TaxID=29159 RepID=K1Q7J7_MAGGI